MSGISSKAAGSLKNKKGFIGKEMQNQEFSDGSGLEFYDFGARNYDPQVGRWWSNDPHSQKYANLTPYNYCLNNPLAYIDPDGKDAIFIVFPDYKIQTPAGKIPYLGHAGVLLIDNKTGSTKYYEYGRYDAENKGLVRTMSISNVVIDKATGKPTQESLQKVMKQISDKSGHGTKIQGAYIESNKFKEMNDYAQQKMKENDDPNRKEYDLNSNNCGTFAADVVDQDPDVAAKSPSITDPRPNSMIDEFQAAFSAVNYDPATNTLSGGWYHIRPEKLIEKSQKYIPKWLKDKMHPSVEHPGSAGPAGKQIIPNKKNNLIDE
jgi:RHS repeat-associated protein